VPRGRAAGGCEALEAAVDCGAERRRERNGWFWSLGVLVLVLDVVPSRSEDMSHEKQLTRVPSECMSDNTSSATASCTVSSVLLAVRGGRFVDLILLYTLPSTAVLFMTHCELAEINKKS
jgi:hypothetical protein